MATTTIPGDIELQEPLGRNRSRVRATEVDEPEGAGYGDTSTQIWKLYTVESERHDRALVDSWKSNADSMLIFTGLFSTIVASFLIETYKTLLPDTGSQTVSLLKQLVAQSEGTAAASPQTLVLQSVTPSAIRVNILMFLSLFFSVTSALASTLIQQWAREYIQYSQPSAAAPHKRGRVRTYLFDGLSRFQMKRLTYGVPVLLHLAVFLFFFAISEWLYPINTLVGATARYCIVALLAVYLALSILPLIVRNAPYQTALTTPLQAIISLIHLSFLSLLQLVRRSSELSEAPRGYQLLRNIRIDRARVLMREIKRRAPRLDRSAMHWLLQELDEDDMDTFLGGLPGYIHSPLTDTKPVVEGLKEDGFIGRTTEHFKTCVTSAELSQEESMSRATNCINSLRLIFETSEALGLENDNIQAIMEYLEPLCYTSNTRTALRASCLRGLLIREFLFPFAYSDPQELQRKKFPDYLMPLFWIIRVWKTTEIFQWPHLIGASPVIADPLPSDQEMWADVLFDGPLINLAVLAHVILLRAGEEEVNLGMAWKTLDVLRKALSLAQIQASVSARAQFDLVLLITRLSVSLHDGGPAPTIPLCEALDTVTSGLYLAGVFSYLPSPKLPPRRIEAIFGKEQLRDSDLLEAFAAHLPGFVAVNTSERSSSFMEDLILENQLWEQLHFSALKCLNRDLPSPDKLRVIRALHVILDIALEALKDSSKIDWQSEEFEVLLGHLESLWQQVTPGMFIGQVVLFRTEIVVVQVCHAMLTQFSMRHSRGEPLISYSLNSLRRLINNLGVGSQNDREYLWTTFTDPDLMIQAEEILSVTLRDGPLSNFCRLGRSTFEAVLIEGFNVPLEVRLRSWTVLRRMLDTTHLPLVNASGEIWAKFHHLRATIHGAAALRSGGPIAEILQPLLEMIEEINRMRPDTDERARKRPPRPRMRNKLARVPLLMGGRAEAPRSEMGSSLDSPHIPPVRGVIPTTEMNRLPPGAGVWIPLTEADSGAMGTDQLPTTSILTTHPGPGPETGIPDPSHAPRVNPTSFASPHVLSDPRRADSLDTANLLSDIHEQSVLTSMPVPPGDLVADRYPPPSATPGPSNAPPLGYASVNQAAPFPVHGPSELPNSDSSYEGDDPGGE